jgi:coenzyme F420-0:L-glutamate ligase / coenzyme F420-1:gamma-L-glutamate ligase
MQLFGVAGLPEIRQGDDLAALTIGALRAAGETLQAGDVVVITSKVVSKLEGRVVSLEGVIPSALALEWATRYNKDPRHVEVVLGETKRIVRMDHGVLIAETRHGFVCANAGVDASNAGAMGLLILLPLDSDASALRLRCELAAAAGLQANDLAVIISDTFGRAWRSGQINIAIGASGILPLRRYLGQQDPEGHTLRATSIAVIDELAAATELVMHKLDRVPVAIVRGYDYPRPGAGEPDPGAALLVRSIERDLFR